MSGLTPILDTLLHQVLGKRVDVAAQGQGARELPVTPANPGTLLRPVESDSRLQPRLDGPQGASFGSSQELPGAPRAELRSDIRARGPTTQADSLSQAIPGRPSGSASKTTFSEPAQWILRLIQNAPRQWAPAVRPPGVLLEPSAGAAPAEQLAERLGQSIRGSGLFYESHLAKWFQGKMAISELAREPQMRLALPRPGVVSGTKPPPMQTSSPDLSGAPRPSAIAVPAQKVDGQELYAPKAGTTGISYLAAGAPNAGGDVRRTILQGTPGSREGPAPNVVDARPEPAANVAQDAQDRLQAIVRHQLELLASPTLKWEGEVTSGVPMFLEILLPESREEALDPERADDEESPSQEPPEWSTQIELFFPKLGELRVLLTQGSAGLELALAAELPESVDILRNRSGSLLDRLLSLGFESPSLNVSALGADEK